MVWVVEFRFKAPPGTSYSYITIHPSGQRNCASWASQPQKSVTIRPQPGGETTKSIRDMWWHWGGKKSRITCNTHNNTHKQRNSAGSYGRTTHRTDSKDTDITEHTNRKRYYLCLPILVANSRISDTISTTNTNRSVH
jgi:hypothetical protein